MGANNKGDNKPGHLSSQIRFIVINWLSNSYAMGCPPVRGDNPQALASGLSYVQVDKHGLTTAP